MKWFPTSDNRKRGPLGYDLLLVLLNSAGKSMYTDNGRKRDFSGKGATGEVTTQGGGCGD
jgi:hypothetical protein